MGEFLALERSLPVGFETLPDISEELVRPIDTTVPTPPCSPASSTLEASRTSVIGNSWFVYFMSGWLLQCQWHCRDKSHFVVINFKLKCATNKNSQQKFTTILEQRKHDKTLSITAIYSIIHTQNIIQITDIVLLIYMHGFATFQIQLLLCLYVSGIIGNFQNNAIKLLRRQLPDIVTHISVQSKLDFHISPTVGTLGSFQNNIRLCIRFNGRHSSNLRFQSFQVLDISCKLISCIWASKALSGQANACSHFQDTLTTKCQITILNIFVHPMDLTHLRRWCYRKRRETSELEILQWK